MKRETIFSPVFKGSYEKISHDSGLILLLCPMPEFSSATAWMTTRYGSIDTSFRLKSSDPYLKVPEGIAHFLEHKLFEDEEGDAFLRFSQMGGDANAFTSYSQTTYLVESTSQFRENLKILLEMVTTPYFTEKAILKERGIIGQEINMYLDDPDSRLELNLLQALYHNNPLNIDIAGTIQSISEITPDLLYDCYGTFYNLHNMVLTICGNFQVEEVLELCDQILKPSPVVEIDRETVSEPSSIVRLFVTEKKEVSLPLFAIGIKNPPPSQKEYATTMASHVLLAELLAGESSPLFTKLYESGVITSPISSYGLDERGAFPTMYSGESENPQKVLEEFQKAVRSMKEKGIDPRQFERIKRQIYGRVIMSFDNVRAVTGLLTAGFLEERDPFLLIETYQTIDISDVEKVLATSFDFDKMALSVIESTEK